MDVSIAVEPDCWRRPALARAVEAGGATVTTVDRARGLVWADPEGGEQFGPMLESAPNIEWIQLPYAGIGPFLPHLDERHRWTCGKGVYAAPVAEMALALMLAGRRGLATYARADSWSRPQGETLRGARILVLGAGGITHELLALLAPFDCQVTVLRRRPEPVEGAYRVATLADRHEELARADAVVLALALTPETTGVIGAPELACMAPDAWLVNVARGQHVVTAELVDALARNAIGGAALDVTDPEPLPPGHPLWAEPRCLITPHVGNTPEMGIELLAQRVTENVRRFAAGLELLGLVDPALGY